MNASTIKLLFYILFFICLGLSTEVIFSSISDFVNGSGDNTLKGYTYVWMVFIYALIPIFYRIGFPVVEKYPFVLRVLLCVLVIYGIEFFAGFSLEQITGKCPWKYTEGWHVMGYIRLDYFIFWFGFASILDSIWRFLEHHYQE